jgi:hypothetical protein
VARDLHKQGHKIPVVGKIQEGWNPVKAPDLGAYDSTTLFITAIPVTLIGASLLKRIRLWVSPKAIQEILLNYL